MTAEQITTILSSLGVIGFLWMWIQAMKTQIGETNKAIEVQKNTLEAMKTQIGETNKAIEVQKNTLEALKTQVGETNKAIEAQRKTLEALKTQVGETNKTIEAQRKTLEALKTQVGEMNKAIEVQRNTLEALKTQITKTNKTIEVQRKTLEGMKTQVSETEKVSSIYSQFIEELPSEIEKYKTLLTKLRGDQISELKKANEYKDERLKETAEIEIKKMELQQRALDDIPALIGQFEEIATTIEQRLSTVDQLVNHIPSQRPATWKWLSAFSTIEPNLLLIHTDNNDTEEEPENKAD
jgi:chromosome segregation ATPase